MRKYDYVSIDGKQYRTVGRAKAGDKVYIPHFDDIDVSEVREIENEAFEGTYELTEPIGDENCLAENRHEEVTVDSSQASEQVIEMFTALSQKVVALEKALASVEFQLRSTQRNVETFAELTESNSEDIRTLDERTQPTVRDALQNTIEVLCAHIAKQSGGDRR